MSTRAKYSSLKNPASITSHQQGPASIRKAIAGIGPSRKTA